LHRHHHRYSPGAWQAVGTGTRSTTYRTIRGGDAMIRQHPIRRGLFAGFLAGSVVAIWFLIVDILTAVPLRTPDFLVQILFGITDQAPTLPLSITFTVLHYAIFAMIGVVTARFRSHLPPGAYLPVGIVVGFLHCDLILYGNLLD